VCVCVCVCVYVCVLPAKIQVADGAAHFAYQ